MPCVNQTHVTLAAGALFFTLVGALVFKKVRKEKIPKEWEEVGTLKSLFLYPVKSGRWMETSKVFCGARGLKEIDKNDGNITLSDRSFVFYTSKDHEVRTARQIPKTVLIETHPAQNGVIFSAPDMTDLYINIPKVKNNVKVTSVWASFFGNEVFMCTDCGDSIAKWLSTFLLGKDEGLRLGYGDGSALRNLIKDHKKFVQYYTKIDNNLCGIFSDLAALHLINQSSVDDVNEKLPEGQKVSCLNFRPNLFVEGPAAFAEDTWEYVKIGEVVAKVCLECVRCIATTVDQNGEINKSQEPLKTLKLYRKSESPFKSPPFGIYLKVLTTGTISQGDKVYVSKPVK